MNGFGPQPAAPTGDPAAAGPPDPFGGGPLAALALGFAAGFGGPSVQAMQEQARQRSWSAYMAAQEMKLRREELAQRENQFRASLDLQERDLEYRSKAEERQSAQAIKLAQINEGGATARALLSEFGANQRQNREFAAKKDERAAGRAESVADAAAAAQIGGIPAVPGASLGALGAGADIAARNRASTDENRRADEAAGLRIWETLRRERADAKQARVALDSNTRAAAVQLAREDVTAGFTRSFDGSVKAYMDLLATASEEADADPSSRTAALLDRVTEGTPEQRAAALRELAASRPTSDGAASRPTAAAAAAPAAGAESRPTPAPEPRIGKLGAKAKEASRDVRGEEVAALQKKRDKAFDDAVVDAIGALQEDERGAFGRAKVRVQDAKTTRGYANLRARLAVQLGKEPSDSEFSDYVRSLIAPNILKKQPLAVRAYVERLYANAASGR